MSARPGLVKALACQLLSFSRFGLALPRTTKRYQRQSGFYALGKPRSALLKCLYSIPYRDCFEAALLAADSDEAITRLVVEDDGGVA